VQWSGFKSRYFSSLQGLMASPCHRTLPATYSIWRPQLKKKASRSYSNNGSLQVKVRLNECGKQLKNGDIQIIWDPWRLVLRSATQSGFAHGNQETYPLCYFIRNPQDPGPVTNITSSSKYNQFCTHLYVPSKSHNLLWRNNPPHFVFNRCFNWTWAVSQDQEGGTN
jgi:hypothetical protein